MKQNKMKRNGYDATKVNGEEIRHNKVRQSPRG